MPAVVKRRVVNLGGPTPATPQIAGADSTWGIDELLIYKKVSGTDYKRFVVTSLSAIIL